ncbi:MAG: FtsX-like permease family protein [Lachnospiraceae bacterium]|nr:FtsX-like permease family protein [Lachnospiraceae bacterium]
MLFKKLIRTIFKYKAQFISMIIMITIGAGIFFGFNIEWCSLEEDTNKFFEETNYADFRIYSETGFTEDDISAIKNADKIDKATRFFSVNVGIKNTETSVALTVLEDYEVSTMYITDGAAYDENSDGIWLSDQFAEKNGYKIGDKITLSYKTMEITGEIVGLVKSGEYLICVADENQLMPDLKAFGFAYITPKKLEEAMGTIFYPQINIISDVTKAEAEEIISNALNKTTMVLSKNEHYSYAGAASEIEEGKTMGSILPVLFLAIAILTMVTTMHRITTNEKIQIGTLKALGFRDSKIIVHYTSFGFVIGLLGTLIGVVLGFAIAAIVVSEDGMMGTYLDMPDWSLVMPPICFVVLVLMIVFLTFISFLSVKQMLKGTAADALRPYVPKKMKKSFLEKLGFWNKLPFQTKWNFRDIMRHKSRSAMTLIGIIGCMTLLVGGLGMKDTMDTFIDLVIDGVNNYETRLNLAETITNEKAFELAEKYNGDYMSSVSIQYKGEALSLDIYNVKNNKIRFLSEDNEFTNITDDGAYICIKLADKGIKIGDTITVSPYGTDIEYNIKVAGIIRSVMTENITITENYAKSLNMDYKINAIFTDTAENDIEADDAISGTQSKQKIADSYDSFMMIMNIMVVILVIAAIILGIVVLYSLGVMSYFERYRELATLKVVGFDDKKIAKLLIGQNVWLTVIGAAIGLPSGVCVLQILITSLVSEYELSLTLGILTYSVSILLTFGTSLLVAFFVARKNKNINMVEALKGSE